MWGWTLMALGLSALAVLVLTSGDIRDRLEGGGGRRISRRAQLAQQRDEITELKQKIAACPRCTPSEFPTHEELIVADALAGPGTTIPAAADTSGWINLRDTPTEDPEHLLTALVDQDPEATQALGVTALREAAQMDAGRTATLPAVTPVVPAPPAVDLPPLTWGVNPKQRPELEAWALGTAPPAGATASEALPTTATIARYKVSAALDGAS